MISVHNESSFGDETALEAESLPYTNPITDIIFNEMCALPRIALKRTPCMSTYDAELVHAHYQYELDHTARGHSWSENDMLDAWKRAYHQVWYLILLREADPRTQRRRAYRKRQHVRKKLRERQIRRLSWLATRELSPLWE